MEDKLYSNCCGVEISQEGENEMPIRDASYTRYVCENCKKFIRSEKNNQLMVFVEGAWMTRGEARTVKRRAKELTEPTI